MILNTLSKGQNYASVRISIVTSITSIVNGEIY